MRTLQVSLSCESQTIKVFRQFVFMSLTWQQRAAEWSEAGISPEQARLESKRRTQRVKRTRRITLAAFCVACLSVLLRLAYGGLHARAIRLAAEAGEPCGPLLGRWVDALVFENRTLWRPRYKADPNARHLLRVQEVSALCPVKTMRVRQRYVNVTSVFLQPISTNDTGAVCLQHFIDALNSSKC